MKSREPGIYRDPSATGRAEAAPESRGSNAALDPALSREEQVARRDDTGRDGALGCREPQSRIASAIARGCSCSESTAKSRLRVETLSSPARRPQRLWQKPITHIRTSWSNRRPVQYPHRARSMQCEKGNFRVGMIATKPSLSGKEHGASFSTWPVV